MHEQMKGEESFFYPYFQIVNRSDLPFLWEPNDIKEFQDAVLQSNIEFYRAEFELEWDLFHKTLMENKYDHIIPGISDAGNKDTLKEKYITAYLTVISRCFGWGLPFTTLIPFADCINHHNVDSSYDLIKKEWKPISVEQYQNQFDSNDS